MNAAASRRRATVQGTALKTALEWAQCRNDASCIQDDEGRIDKRETFWVKASLVEALVGLGRVTRANDLRAALAAEAPESWMAATMNEQLAQLEALLAAAPAADGSMSPRGAEVL